ncbi:hypothetical protein NC99_06100 [Sunxiuqinia dokdonensis]|uniref:Uncharacterized protein n=1 Tax=Sunxiuqinia dokdonensis TaxID=1409788 RepID=A0A0L8VE73_9BACT|nr:hypothetical protein NC99_06100 [Sunxiuqinia dokdonensis]
MRPQGVPIARILEFVRQLADWNFSPYRLQLSCADNIPPA